VHKRVVRARVGVRARRGGPFMLTPHKTDSSIFLEMNSGENVADATRQIGLIFCPTTLHRHSHCGTIVTPVVPPPGPLFRVTTGRIVSLFLKSRGGPLTQGPPHFSCPGRTFPDHPPSEIGGQPGPGGARTRRWDPSSSTPHATGGSIFWGSLLLIQFAQPGPIVLRCVYI
jgi:hypothetical protein